MLMCIPIYIYIYTLAERAGPAVVAPLAGTQRGVVRDRVRLLK